ncbi:MAG TPA: response regulator transcription factor [Thermomicrobiales bacterium]|nr:response regulator transcription factor [Thermomicrobiales bacterium]
MIRVMIAEDQAMVRGALVALLGLEPDIEVVADVASGDVVVETVLRIQPDVVLMDIEMPRMNGITAAGAIHEHVPDCKVLILTTFGRPGYLRGAMDAGAVGFLVKDAPASELADAIRRAMRGERVIDPDLAMAALSSGPNPLTDRQREVLRLSLGGASIAEMAQALFLSEGTVRNYLSEAIAKLDVRNRIEAARLAEERGWL